MTREELIRSAEAGDEDAMLQLVEDCVSQSEWNDAIKWADMAAETENLNGIYKAENLHAVRMLSIVGQAAPFWDTLKEDAQAVQKYVTILIANDETGAIQLGDSRHILFDCYRNAVYCEAVVCYRAEDDYDKALELLKKEEGTREQVLAALCRYALGQYDDAYRIMESAYQDQAYTSEQKLPVEEQLYTSLIIFFALMTRTQGDPGKAAEILDRGIAGVNDDPLKSRMQEERARYRRTVLGRWTYK